MSLCCLSLLRDSQRGRGSKGDTPLPRSLATAAMTFATPLLLTQVPVLDVPLTTRLSLVLIVAGLLLFLCAALVQQWRGQA